jgi:cyclase
MVLSIEAKQVAPGQWEVYTENGRQRTGLDVVEWAIQGVALGAGELLLTSVDREGTRSGFDIELLKSVTSKVSVPVIASGGLGEPGHLLPAVFEGGADAVAIADVLHYNRAVMGDIRSVALSAGMGVRDYEAP